MMHRGFSEAAGEYPSPGTVVKVVYEKRRERPSLLAQQPLLGFKGHCQAVPTRMSAGSIKTKSWLEAAGVVGTPLFSAGNLECAVHRVRQENKATQPQGAR